MLHGRARCPKRAFSPCSWQRRASPPARPPAPRRPTPRTSAPAPPRHQPKPPASPRLGSRGLLPLRSPTRPPASSPAARIRMEVSSSFFSNGTAPPQKERFANPRRVAPLQSARSKRSATAVSSSWTIRNPRISRLTLRWSPIGPVQNTFKQTSIHTLGSVSDPTGQCSPSACPVFSEKKTTSSGASGRVTPSRARSLAASSSSSPSPTVSAVLTAACALAARPAYLSSSGRATEDAPPRRRRPVT